MKFYYREKIPIVKKIWITIIWFFRIGLIKELKSLFPTEKGETFFNQLIKARPKLMVNLTSMLVIISLIAGSIKFLKITSSLLIFALFYKYYHSGEPLEWHRKSQIPKPITEKKEIQEKGVEENTENLPQS